VTDEDCWNFDKTGFRMGVERYQKVIIKAKNKNNPRFADPDNRELVTSIKCVNCVGASIPAVIVLAGKQLLESMINNNLDNDVAFTFSDIDYSNDIIILQWLKHFDQHSKKYLKGVNRMLIMDGYGSHLTLEFVDYC